MDAAIIGVAGTLLGGLVGGLLTHWNSTALARLEMKWQQIRLRQEKLEEIAALLDQIDQYYKKLMGEILLKVESNKPFDTNGERIPFERLRILMEFYACSGQVILATVLWAFQYCFSATLGASPSL